MISYINKRKPCLSVITDDFNTICSSYWSNNINTAEGSRLFLLTSSNEFSQLINETTHTKTSNSSYTDLIFTDQQNLSVNSAAHTSSHPNRYQQILHFSFSLNIYNLVPYH